MQFQEFTTSERYKNRPNQDLTKRIIDLIKSLPRQRMICTILDLDFKFFSELNDKQSAYTECLRVGDRFSQLEYIIHSRPWIKNSFLELICKSYYEKVETEADLVESNYYKVIELLFILDMRRLEAVEEFNYYDLSIYLISNMDTHFKEHMVLTEFLLDISNPNFGSSEDNNSVINQDIQNINLKDHLAISTEIFKVIYGKLNFHKHWQVKTSIYPENRLYLTNSAVKLEEFIKRIAVKNEPHNGKDWKDWGLEFERFLSGSWCLAYNGRFHLIPMFNLAYNLNGFNLIFNIQRILNPNNEALNNLSWTNTKKRPRIKHGKVGTE